MSGRQRATERITETVTAWPGVSAGPATSSRLLRLNYDRLVARELERIDKAA